MILFILHVDTIFGSKVVKRRNTKMCERMKLRKDVCPCANLNPFVMLFIREEVANTLAYKFTTKYF